jgi:hypothetical protein
LLHGLTGVAIKVGRSCFKGRPALLAWRGGVATTGLATRASGLATRPRQSCYKGWPELLQRAACVATMEWRRCGHRPPAFATKVLPWSIDIAASATVVADGRATLACIDGRRQNTEEHDGCCIGDATMGVLWRVDHQRRFCRCGKWESCEDDVVKSPPWLCLSPFLLLVSVHVQHTSVV